MAAIAPILPRQLLPLRFFSYSSIFRQYLLSILGIIRKYPMIQKLMCSWLWNNRRQSFHKLQQAHLNGARTIRPRCLQQYPIFPFPIRNQSILRKWWSRNIPTQLLQSLSILGRYLNTTNTSCLYPLVYQRSIYRRELFLCGIWTNSLVRSRNIHATLLVGSQRFSIQRTHTDD